MLRSVVPVGCFLCGSRTVGGTATPSFAAKQDFATSVNPLSVTVGNLNGDDKLDLAGTHSTSNTVSILLGNGDGTFPTHAEYGVGSGPAGIAIGDFNGDGRLDLAEANNTDNTVSVLLQGTTVALSDTTLRFGLRLVGTASSPQEVTLTNTGPITLTISSITASGDFLQRNNCGSSLPAGESCTIRIAFKPTDKGIRTGDVTITDDAANSPQVIALTGTGTFVQLTPSSLDFGGQRVGTISRPQTVTLTNTGSTSLSIRGIGIVGNNFSDFIETTTCGSSVPAHTSCTIDVRFKPAATGPRTASIKMQHDGGGDQPVKLTGIAVSN